MADAVLGMMVPKTARISVIVALGWLFLGLGSGGRICGQRLMSAGGPVRLYPTDAAVLDTGEVRNDLFCTVQPSKPDLGFDLKFHAGYQVSVPLRELAGEENGLVTLFRVIPEGGEAVPFVQKLAVPSIEEDAKGDALLQGHFDVGEGKYHVDWMMRDRSERVCSAFWDVDASLPPRDRQITLAVPAGAVRTADEEPFKQEAPVERAHDGPINVKVIVNFAPQDSASAILQPLDTNALCSILRNIAREPRIGKFTLVAFNMQEQRVVYRQQDASQIDFPALGEALKSLNLGTVDLKRLTQKHGDSEFLADLITKEMTDQEDRPDAVIFAGPKVVLESGLTPDELKPLADVKLPVFYMNYNLNPTVNPWRDGIGTAVHFLRGSEFTISRPRDLFFAWSEIIGRIVKSRVGRPSTVAASSQ